MSANQSSFGRVAVKRRPTRSGAGAAARSGMVVRRRLPRREMPSKPELAHQAGDPLAAYTDAVRLAQLGVHAGRSVRFERLEVDSPDQPLELGVLECSLRRPARTPGVVAGACHPEHAAQPGDAMLCLLRLDQPKGHGRRSVSRAKKSRCRQPVGRNIGSRAGGVALARKRREYSARERWELWERWKRGESVSEIGRALDRAPGTIRTIRLHGGVAPHERRRSRLALTVQEREEISRGVAAGDSARGIAARLGRSPSTITRELNRHGGRRRYRAAEADGRAWARARRPQRCKLARNPVLSSLVAAKLREDWRPSRSPAG